MFAFCVAGCADAPPSPGAHTREYWQARIARVHPGMKRADVEELLPVLSTPEEKKLPKGFPDGHADIYAVDPDWRVEVPYDFTGFVQDGRKNPYGVMHLYDNRVIGPIKLIHKHTVIDWKAHGEVPP
jgi:hypothetical protein